MLLLQGKSKYIFLENLIIPNPKTVTFCYMHWQRLWTLRIFALAGNPFLLLSYSLPPSLNRFWRRREINPRSSQIPLESPSSTRTGWCPALFWEDPWQGWHELWHPREGLSILSADSSWRALGRMQPRAAWHILPFLWDISNHVGSTPRRGAEGNEGSAAALRSHPRPPWAPIIMGDGVWTCFLC